jgi:protein involved in polysaccharide export with SLBB domain
LAAVAGLGSGCLDKGFLDQTEMGRFPKKPLIVPIVSTLDPTVEEPDMMFTNASGPTADDLVAQVSDYTISPNDLIAVTIPDLIAQGVETVKVLRVSETGRISLPLINQIAVSELTEAQAEEAIKAAYRDANIMPQAQVSVVVQERRGKTYWLSGAFARTGQFPILENDLRLLDALNNSGEGDVVRGTRGYNTVYIIRRTGGGSTSPTAPSDRPTSPDLLVPRGDSGQARAIYAQDAGAPATQPARAAEGRYVIIDGKPVLVPATGEAGAAPAAEPVPTPAAETPAAPAAPTAAPAAESAPTEVATPPAETTAPSTAPFEFNAPQEPGDIRVIKVPLDKLLRGELKYNVVIRPRDVIFLAAPAEGVYYMGGHVNRTGVYQLGFGNQVTLRNAIISAGGLDPIGVPERTMITRRIGPDRAVMVTVNLAKIFEGEEPDIFLKRDDEVMVGTAAWAPFLAALRNGFRITYGFGFLYDRNYAPDDNNN